MDGREWDEKHNLRPEHVHTPLIQSETHDPEGEAKQMGFFFLLCKANEVLMVGVDVRELDVNQKQNL